MALTRHHDLINHDYFNMIHYVRDLEHALNRKLTDEEKDIIENTFKTFLKINNEWSNYSNNNEDSFYNNKKELETYLKKYDRTINKCVDLFCVNLYKTFEEWLDEMEDIESRDLDKKCNGIKSSITEILNKLEDVEFDYVWNGYFYYKRNSSNKTKRHYCSVIEYEQELYKFIQEYNEKNEYNTIQEDITSDEIEYIRVLYKIFATLSYLIKFEKYDEALREIIHFFRLSIPTYLNDDFKKELDRVENISNLIINKEYENAYQEIIKFIQFNDKWYVRAS